MALCGVLKLVKQKNQCKMYKIVAKGFAFRYMYKKGVKMLLPPIYKLEVEKKGGSNFFSN